MHREFIQYKSYFLLTFDKFKQVSFRSAIKIISPERIHVMPIDIKTTKHILIVKTVEMGTEGDVESEMGGGAGRGGHTGGKCFLE